ncbi:hypothetical protein SAMN05216474_0777 [Lishizhenia tianjinensis]|uniref:Uncharacterized protein n=1 Tax=Lishizhenia tianjinensis TaxID=477690 RepID=A0A1I6YBP6_9FLAO|nr:hypothetical protein SAMN05216474_0777 [Lishizhenia tianjinensis]
MKLILTVFTLLCLSLNSLSQTCDELMETVKSKSFGTTYTSYTSTAISKVTFYTVYLDYSLYYFAIVCFKPNEYSYDCSEYIYQVASNTQTNYAMNYMESAGEAFWDYIQPYADVLECSPSFE